ncbi:MAG: hypothetical protein LLF94_07555 [Chlamydiales bacterium]|nr:hypothetical protein [Chlamydiales bacterium]
MWKKSYSKIYAGVKKQTAWDLSIDVNTWHEWHRDIDFCKMEGPFEVGNHFMLKPKGVKPFKIMLTDVQEGHSFTDCTTFFGAKMYDTHAFEETPEGLKLTNTLVVTGPLKWLWIKLVAQDVANSIPEQMETLIMRARGSNG